MIRITKDGKVFLLLEGKSYKGTRYLGYIEGDTFHCTRNPDKHLFRQMNAYGFCYELMRDGSFLKVEVHLFAGETLVTTRQRILQIGEMLNYKSHQLEPQVFLSVDKFGADGDIPDDEALEQSPPEEPSTDKSPSPTDDDEPTDTQLDFFGGEL